VIHGGITIHQQAVIGAGAVVLKDVPPGATVAGNPARIIKIAQTLW
jgi:acetyltransferase-like isoleucine patch superfamily enzyme